MEYNIYSNTKGYDKIQLVEICRTNRLFTKIVNGYNVIRERRLQMETSRKQMITRFVMCMLLALAMFCTVFADETYAASKKPARVSITSVKSADHNAVKITWKKAKNAKKYQVYRAASKNGKYKLIKTTKSRTFTNTKLTTGKKYYYKVRAVNGTKKGAFSRKKYAIPKLKKTTGAKAASAGYNSLKLTWKKVNGAKGYQVYRATSKNGTYSKVKTTTALSFTNTKLTTGKTYYYKVRAYKKVGSKTRYGAFSTVTATYPAPAKTGEVKASSAGYDSIKLTWSKAAGAKGYQVYRATSKSGKYTKVKTTTSLSYTNTGLTAGKTYYYKVRAYTKVGDTTRYGAFSFVVSAQPVKEQTEQTKPSEQENDGEGTDGTAGENTQGTPGNSGSEAVTPDDTGETTAYGGEVRKDCYLDYGSVRIYIGQKWSDSLNASINAQTGAGGAVAKTATRTGINYYDIPVTIEIYCFDTVDFDNFLYVEVANGYIAGWKTNALTTGIIGVYEGTPIRIKTQESVYANDPVINWGGFGVYAYAHTEKSESSATAYSYGDVMYGGLGNIDGSGCPDRAAIEEEEQIAEYIVNMYRACRGVSILQHSDLLYGDETYGTKCLAKSQADEGKVAHDGFIKGPFAGMDVNQINEYNWNAIDGKVIDVGECCGASNTYAEITIHQFYESYFHRANMIEDGRTAQSYGNITLLAVAGYVNPETGKMYIAFHTGSVRNDVPRSEEDLY